MENSTESKEKKHQNLLGIKICLFLQSMTLFFIIVGLLCLDLPIYTGPDSEFLGWKCIWQSNWICFLYLGFVILFEWVIHKIITHYWKTNNPNLSIVIDKISPKSYDSLIMLTSIFIPLVSFRFDQVGHWLVLLLLFIVIGVISCKADGYYNNPTLVLFGYKLYWIEAKNQSPDADKQKEEWIVFTKDILEKDDTIRIVDFNSSVGFAIKEKTKKESK